MQAGVEEAILHRKNAYFYKTSHGAHMGDVFMSLIHTCELCGVSPFDVTIATSASCVGWYLGSTGFREFHRNDEGCKDGEG